MCAIEVKCPTCQRKIDWSDAPFRPFCSERCRMIDLGAWLSEQRSIAGESVPEDPAAGADDKPHEP